MPVLHPALWLLLRKTAKSKWRQVIRSCKQPKKILPLLAVVAWLCLTFGPSLTVSIVMDTPPTDPAKVIQFAPFFMLLMCLIQNITPAAQKAIAFSPSEIYFLFTGPFTRRELLYYKFVTALAATLFFSLIFSAAFLQHATYWFMLFTGIFLALLFIHLISLSIALVRETVAEWFCTTPRKIVLALFWIAIVVGIVLKAAQQEGSGILPMLQSIRDSWFLMFLLKPFETFARIGAATQLFPDFVVWTTIGVIQVALVLALVIRLDANYLSVSITASRKFYERVERAKRSGIAVQATHIKWLNVPMLPWLGGIGPTVWRHGITAIRTAKGFLILLVIMAVVILSIIIPLSFSIKNIDMPLVLAIAYATFILSLIYPTGFRCDINYMENLKVLPLHPLAVVLGESCMAVALLTLLHATLLLPALFLPNTSQFVLLTALVFSIPFNFLLFGIDNLILLVYPMQMSSSVSQDFQQFGRNMLGFFIKFILIILAGVLAGGLGGLAYWYTHSRWIGSLLVAWPILILESMAIIPLLTWAFIRFDVNADSPL